jgi:hypothetical protein
MSSAQMSQADNLRENFSKSKLSKVDVSTGGNNNGLGVGSPIFLSSLTVGKSSASSVAAMATKVRTMSNVRNFAKKLKLHAQSEDNIKPPVVLAIQPPKCLENILKKINSEKPKETAASKANKKLDNLHFTCVTTDLFSLLLTDN